MAYVFLKHYNPTQVLMKYLKLLTILMLIWVTVACSTKPLNTKELDTIDSLLLVLNSNHVQLLQLDSLSFNKHFQRIEMYLSDEEIGSNIAAIESLESAHTFFQTIAKEKTSLMHEIDVSVKQLNSLKSAFQSKKHATGQLNKWLFDESNATQALQHRSEYLFSRWNAQLLLLETFDKAYHEK